jgi:ubiquinone/menaquinone biosynthesis C-methylase UbiE
MLINSTQINAMAIPIINPTNNLQLNLDAAQYTDSEGNRFAVVRGVPRIAELNNYTENFGVQWNKFDKTQFDRENDGFALSKVRFFAESDWSLEDLAGKDLLEVGSGAGRFSKVVLEHTQANLYSVDYSDAVSANFKNNHLIAPGRFHLFQASVYEMPFPDNSFDKVFCFGVLQHTPNFKSSVKALINKAKPGGEVVVDFYPINGWWTKIHAKYLFRPWTKKLNHQRLFKLIEKNVDWLIKLSNFLNKVGLSSLTRILPLVDLNTLPKKGLSDAQLREWVILDTFDMFSPEHDHPQKIKDVAKIFNDNGADVTFADYVEFGDGFRAAVVRGIKRV